MSYALEIRATNIFDTWYGTWQHPWSLKADTEGITEDEVSVRFFGSNFKGGLDILYYTYWDQEFKIKDKSATHITWKDIVFERPEISVALGDFYYTLGQGLILGMEPDRTSEQECLIEGIKVGTKLSCLELTQIWGIPLKIDRSEMKYKILNDTSDVLFGINARTPLFSRYGFLLSCRGLRLKTEDTLYTNLWGEDFEFSWDWGTWYLEMAQKNGWDRIDFEEQSGYGVYSSLDIYLVNIQFMNYNKLGIGNITYRYNLMPILNRSGYSINNGRDEIGFQITVGKAVGDVVLDFSHSEIYTRDTTLENRDKRIIEYYEGTDFGNFNSSMKFLLLDGNVDSHFEERRELESETHGSFKNIETTLSVERVDAVTWQDSTIIFFDIGLAIEFPIWEVLTLRSSYTRRSKEVIEEARGIEWYGFGLKFEPSSTVFLDLWAGKEKGGATCSAGMCRELVPFDGFKLQLNMTL